VDTPAYSPYGAAPLPERQRRSVPVVEAVRGLVVETPDTGFCGAVMECAKDVVVLEDRHGARRTFPLDPAGFLLDGELVTLIRPSMSSPAPTRRTASGSTAVPGVRARIARQSRIYVEGIQDAELVEKIWGDDLRIEGVVVEPLGGIDDLPGIVAEFRPGPARRLGVLVDHLVPGSKETRIIDQITASRSAVLVVGHPYVDVWETVRPEVLGLPRWPVVPRGQPWKDGVCAALGWPPDTGAAWRRILSQVRSYADLSPKLLGPVERLIDFVTGADT
jgi:hypothetical protein